MGFTRASRRPGIHSLPRRLRWLAHCLLLLACTAQLRALGTGKPLQQYGHQAWQSDAGLPQNTVRAIAQTSDGYLWIGTEAGLVRYDGVDFRVFDPATTPALHSGFISGLRVDASGTSLWISTPDGLACEHAGSFTAYGVADGLPSQTVLGTYVTGDGKLLALTTSGAALLLHGRFRLIDNTARLAMTDATSLVAEDARGQVWLAGPAGVAPLSLATSLPGPGSGPGGILRDQTSAGLLDPSHLNVGQLQALALDSAGGLWVGGASGLTRVGAQPLTIHNGLPSNDVTTLLAAKDGGLWAGTSKGLAYIAPGVMGAAPPRAQEPATASSRLRSGLIRTLPEFAGQRVQNLFLDRAGTLWVATTDGLARVSPGSKNPASVAQRSASPTSQSSVDLARPVLPGILSIFEDREGSMWFGTDTAGLHVLREQVFSTLTAEDGLSASLVRAVFEDHAGTMWIGTSGGGLDMLPSPATGRVVQAFPGKLPSRVILALAETGSSPPAPSDLARPQVTARTVGTSEPGQSSHDKPGHMAYDLWIGTPAGLVRVPNNHPPGNSASRPGDPGRIRVYTTADGLADDFVRSLYADRDGSLWIGTRNGLSHWKDGRFRSYSKLDGLASDLIGVIVRSRAGELYAGTLGGLSRMTGDGFVDALPPAEAGGKDGAITALLEDSEGTLWLGSNNQGLSCLRGGRLTRFMPSATVLLHQPTATTPAAGRSTAGLPATIFGMLQDAGGNLWLSSRTGVDQVSLAALHAFADSRSSTVPVTHYGTADGMRISEGSGGGHPAASRAHDGGLWFATLNGAAVVHPAVNQRNLVPPVVAIEQVLIDDQPAALPGIAPGRKALGGDPGTASQPAAPSAAQNAIRVAPGHGRLTIQYAGLSFVAPQKVRYRYQLAGFDKTWINAGSRRTAFYTNVPPGSYRFLVLAANNDGVWSRTPADVRFIVQPYLYQTKWFYALVAFTLLGLGYLAYRWRVRLVEAQYQAVLGERGRIAREIHDTLAQGYVAIAVQLELAERLLANSAEAAAQQLRQTRELVRESLADARSSIWNLRAQTDAETLPSQLAAYCLTLQARLARRPDEAATSLRFAVHGTYRPLARTVEAEVQRVAQEAILNATRHARASLITASLTYGGQLLELRVADDGVGLHAVEDSSARGHFGVQGMRERAIRIGAVFAIESAPGEGTRVTLQVDLRRAARPAGEDEKGKQL